MPQEKMMNLASELATTSFNLGTVWICCRFFFFGKVLNKLPGKSFQAERMFEILRKCLRAAIPQLTDLLCKPQQHTQGAGTNTQLNTTQIQ